MSDWQPISTAKKDGSIVRVRYVDGSTGDCRWLTEANGKNGSKNQGRRLALIAQHGGFWAHARLTCAARLKPVAWRP